MPMLTKVPIAYPKVPDSTAGTTDDCQPFDAAIPAAVVGPASNVSVGSSTGIYQLLMLIEKLGFWHDKRIVSGKQMD